MKYCGLYPVMACLAAMLTAPALADVPAKGADPGEAEIEAVLGAQTMVKRTGPAQYVIDGDPVSLQQLLAVTLPQKEDALKAMQDNIRQRQAIQDQAAGGMSLDAKRAQCQGLAANSIDRTRCYQELAALRDQAGQSVKDAAEQQREDQAQQNKLQQEIDGIDRFRQQYGMH